MVENHGKTQRKREIRVAICKLLPLVTCAVDLHIYVPPAIPPWHIPQKAQVAAGYPCYLCLSLFAPIKVTRSWTKGFLEKLSLKTIKNLSLSYNMTTRSGTKLLHGCVQYCKKHSRPGERLLNFNHLSLAFNSNDNHLSCHSLHCYRRPYISLLTSHFSSTHKMNKIK